MNRLINAVKRIIQNKGNYPLSVYSSVKEQRILNVPIVKPLLIFVLNGTKYLGNSSNVICENGDFVMLFDSPAWSMRNIPEHDEYLALLIEFEHDELNAIQYKPVNNIKSLRNNNYCYGKSTDVLNECLIQLVECVSWAPEKIISNRKIEIVDLLVSMGHTDILSLCGSSKVQYQVNELYNNAPAFELTVDTICRRLGMSESTLRRKLKSEGTSLQNIKDQARLGLGLHLIQTTDTSIGLIAERCGYQSQSKFSSRFKRRFGLTPKDLRQTIIS